jgi:hypothetical protein
LGAVAAYGLGERGEADVHEDGLVLDGAEEGVAACAVCDEDEYELLFFVVCFAVQQGQRVHSEIRDLRCCRPQLFRSLGAI